MYYFWSRNWFLIGIVVSIIAAEIYPDLGRTGGVLAPEWSAKYGAVGLIFCLAGCSLSVKDVSRGLSCYRVHLFIQLFTFLFVPLFVICMNFAASPLFHANAWILKGMLTVACMPPPVSSAVVLTKAAGGNQAAAVFNSVLGSLLGILVTPFLLLFFLGSTALLSTVHSILVLGCTVVVPMCVGLALRHWGLVPPASTRAEILSQSTLLFIVYTSFCDAFVSFDSPLTAADVLSSVLMVLVTQVCLLYVSFHGSLWLRAFTAQDIVAIAFCSTHKSLTLGLPILRVLFNGYSHFSQVALPLLVYHPTQILVGGLLVPPFKQWILHHRHRSKILP